MNTRLHDQLQKWVTGKPPLLGLLAPTAVFACDTFRSLLTSDKGKELLQRCSARDDKIWANYYASPVDLIRDLIREVALQDSDLFLEVVDAWQELSEGNRPAKSLTDSEIDISNERFLQHLKNWCQSTINNLVT